ncbi:NDMA-dependent alcohol dehydrogenase [Actinocorallia aurantiaca]|uniref:NDMA-dependent alcohol dehydrogenase n=1 Tax=Actinocorallia aurantiaca TaxID=46204 RepID=A0ABP6GTM2_9ACTN
MKTKAAILWGQNEKWQIEEVELDPPKEGEVLVKLVATGLCHSDEHLVTGDIPMPLPVIGGHEGAGVVVQTGPGVTEVAEGDSIVFSFIPSCGRCSYCARGMQNLCDLGAHLINGPQLDGTYRFHARGQNIGQMSLLGAFAEYTVVPIASVVKIDNGSPLDKAALLGCGVPTGYGSAVRTAEVKAGETVVVQGIGGIGASAVQGARIAGARNIIAIDPVEFKRTKALELGATHAVASVEEAGPLVVELTRGNMADSFIITTDRAESSYISPALDLVTKRGKVIVTAVANFANADMSGNLFMLTMLEKQIRGSLYGSSNAHHEIPRLLELYKTGQLKLDEMITKEYTLDEVNQGYEDMRNGTILRGVIRF